jgi:LuxR family transcriptional regulator, maltose regulon positive regulatory protein
MQKPDLLIHTKLRLPPVRSNLVPRPRLQQRILQGLRCALSLIIAPAGFGKTTLVTSSVTRCGIPVAWLSLDKNDNQPERFLSYLVAALQEVDQTIGGETLQLMTGVQQAPPGALLTTLINELDASRREIILVLDDYQFITSPNIHEQVTFLLEHCPDTFHLLMATRSDPPLPVARLRARGQMVELRAADLRFTSAEAAQFLNDIMGLCLDTSSVRVLEERTEGWIAGLQMAALSMRDREDVQVFISGFSGTNRFILDYLLEEILSSQSLEIQRFLLFTSVLERLSAPLCEAVLEGETLEDWRVGELTTSIQPFNLPACQRIIGYLERENLFLIPLDDERIWFRYHHLFADLLKDRMRLAQPETVLRLHIRASNWLEQKGFIPEAIQQLFIANEIERAADMLERYGPERWVESDPSLVQMADHLPFETLIARPKLGLYLVWLLTCQGHIGKALRLLHDMSLPPETIDSNSGRQWIQTIITLVLAFLTPLADAPGVKPLPDHHALNEIPTDEPILRDAAIILYGMTLARRGEVDLAEEVSAMWLRREKTSHGKLAIPALVAFLARIYFMQGRLQVAASLCHEFLNPIQLNDHHLIYNAGNMYIVLGEVLFERNCLEDAETQIRAGLQANEPWQNLLTDAFGLIALTRILQAKGDYTGAMQVVNKFETKLQGPSQPIEFKEELRTLKVRLQLASGDLQNTFDWADQIQRSEDFHLHEEYYWLTLARIRIIQGRYAEVEELLTRKSSPSRASNRITRQIESNLLLAAAIAGQHRWPEASRLIETCLALAEPEGYMRVFLDIGEPARALLTAYLGSDSPARRHYAQEILEMLTPSNGARSPLPGVAGLIEPLSQRELEVLRLMALGKTNQEIARELIVSPGTVKAHTASIYRKLDVANRTEAAARARFLGLLP